MSDFFSLYPVYDSEATKDTFEIGSYSLKYTDEDNTTYPLELKSDDMIKDYCFVNDPNQIWNHDEYGFTMERKIIIRNPSSLFGKGEYAIACDNSTLGVAFRWSSKSSSRKATRKIATFVKNDRDKEIEMNFRYERCFFRGEVNFSIILFLETPGIPQKDEDLFINQSGFILGELDSITVRFDGEGSILPVLYEKVSGGPLWRVKCNIYSPGEEAFSDDVIAIYINTDNPNFKFIEKKNDLYNPQMANEVMATAISMIIESVRAVDPNFASLKNPENGSVSDAVRYFRDVLSWDLSSPISVNQSIREAFENKKE